MKAAQKRNLNSTLYLKRSFGSAWSRIPSWSPRRVILLYHAVGAGPWASTPDLFARQMEWVAQHARPVSLAQALGTANEKKLEVAITFDDGYASVYENAWPVLKCLGLTASVFLNTSLVGQGERVPSDPAAGHYPDESFLLWSEVDQMLDSGWSVGSHGAHHFDHTREDDAVVRRELFESKKKLEELTPGPCRFFAYTWGRNTPHLRKLVREAGYTWALSGRHGSVSVRSNPFQIPRINIDRNYSLADFEAIVTGDWDYLRFIQAMRSA